MSRAVPVLPRYAFVEWKGTTLPFSPNFTLRAPVVLELLPYRYTKFEFCDRHIFCNYSKITNINKISIM